MNATDERAALMRAILEQPADDTPRLVFADWLTENADGPADLARARFIRHQIAESHHNMHVYYPAFEVVRDEWDAGAGKSDNGPIQPDRNTPARREYFRAYYKCRLMQTQTRLMLERWAGEWLAELARLVLPAEYYAWRQVGTKKRLPPNTIVRRDDPRGWIEFEVKELSTVINSGPLFSFRRGFVWQIDFRRFYQPVNDTLLAEMFRRCPIERVRSNRKPAEHQMHTFGSDGRVMCDWHWCADDYALGDVYPADGTNYPMNALPDRIYDRLPNLKRLKGCYPDEPTAVADFQWACVAIGRELAGLSKLPKPPCPKRPNPKATASPRRSQT